MNDKITPKINTQPISPQVLQYILKELRLLRQEVMLLFPQDDLEAYAHPKRIKSSYQKALKKYPPAVT